MPLRILDRKMSDQVDFASYTLTIPKDDLRMDGYLELLEQLEDYGENLQVHIQRTGKGEWKLTIREDLLDPDVRAQLDLPAEQVGLDEIEAEAD